MAEEELDTSFLEDSEENENPEEDEQLDGIGYESPSEDRPKEGVKDEPQKKGGVQKRIDKLTKQMRDYERENIYLHGRIEQLEKSGHAKPEEKPDQLSRDDFESDEAYIQALNKQNLEILRQEKNAEAAKESDREKEREQQVVNEKLDEGRQKYDDFDEVALSPHTHSVTQKMLDAAMGDNFADILYVLGRNPAVSNKIAQMTPTQQVKEIAKIETHIEVVRKQQPKPEEEPAPTLKSGGSSAHSIKDESQMSFKERMARWDADREARLRRDHGLA